MVSESPHEDHLTSFHSNVNREQENLDISSLVRSRKNYPNNPLIGYLNINSLRNKIDCLQILLEKAPLDILCVDETKLDNSFPDPLFQLQNYQFPPLRRDRNSRGGGKIVFIKHGIISKRLENFETKNAETICIEFTISKKKWCILFVYRPPGEKSKTFFEEISTCLCHIMTKYENIFVAGDINIDTLNSNGDPGNIFHDFRNNFELKNLVTQPTCFKSLKGTSLDVLLTNKPNCFQKTLVCETGLSDHHKLVATFFRSTFVKHPAKEIRYRCYKNFEEDTFRHELDQLLIRGQLYASQDPYSELTSIFSNLLDQHAPVKVKKIRGNQAPFMNRELSKAIMDKSRSRNKYLKLPSQKNYLSYKKIKNRSNSVLRKTKRQYFSNISKSGKDGRRTFWNTVKPFMSNKTSNGNDQIAIEVEGDKEIVVKNRNEKVQIKTNDIISDEKILVELFNDHYINIVEISSGLAPTFLGNPSNPDLDSETVSDIIETYKYHPSITQIKENFRFTETFDLPKATVADINSIILNINPKKASGPDKIPLKIIKSCANTIDSHITNIINQDIERNRYSEEAKSALVRPIYKKDDRSKIKNYRPISLLNGLSKVYERYLHDKLTSYSVKVLSQFVAAYRKSYSSNHVLLRLIEEWKTLLDNKNFVGTVLMDLSKAFDCIPHDLLIAKLHAYGFSKNTVIFLYSYLKPRK